MIAVVLIVVLVVAAAGGLVRWSRLTSAGQRTIQAPQGELEDLFRGGVMSRHILTSGPLVRLECYDWGVRLRGSAISRWVVPTWEAGYDELAIARLVALPASRITVWFRLRGAQPDDVASAIGFLSDHSALVIRQLEKHGVPVDRHVTQIRQVKELYDTGR